MSRDDTMLYSGSTSASFTTVKEQPSLKKRRDVAYEKKQVLKPSADIIFQEIEAEKKAAMYIKNIDISSSPDEKMFMIEMMARQKYVEYLDRLKVKMQNVLKDKP